MDKKLKKELRNLLKNARKKNEDAIKSELALRNFIGVYLGDPKLSEVPTKAENADNLEKAIDCFIYYGEYNIDEIIEELDSIE